MYKSNEIMPWYIFNPIDSFPHNACDPNNYDLIGINPPNCPSPNLRLCAIQAYDNFGVPIITQALCAEIATAVINQTETTNVVLRPTLYP
jgi:hypothetical protein